MMKGALRRLIRRLVFSLALVALFQVITRGRVKPVGRFLGVPYDLRWPTPQVLKERFWNPEDERILTPHVMGWGWSINLHALSKRLGLIKPAEPSAD